MDKKQFDVKELAAFMSQKSVFDFVNASKDGKEKQERIEQMKRKFLSGNHSGFSNDNGSWVQAMGDSFADVGNESFSLMSNAEFNFELFNKEAKAEHGIQTIKRLIARTGSGVQESIKQYLTSRNSVIKKNKEKKAEADKLKRDGWQST